MKISRRRDSMPVFLSGFLAVVALAAVSLAIAFAWHNSEDSIIAYGASAGIQRESGPEDSVKQVDPKTLEIETQNVARSPEPDASEKDGVYVKTASEAARDAALQQEDEPDSTANMDEYVREAAAGSVLKSQTEDYSYFDDAIFFGDSISTGIPLYMKTLVPGAAVVAMTGINPDNANYSQCIDVDGTRVTMLEAAKTKGARGKVYIMLGANGLDLDGESFVKGYKAFLQSVREMYPEASVYLQSMLPVTSQVNKVYTSKNVNNQRISEYNGLILSIAKEFGVYYLDVAQCVEDENGFLPVEASPFDGMHLTPEYYVKWFDYLRSHTVKTKK